ncbi:MAG: diguanylate cyclase [Polyangiaceae bacterium]
MGSGIVLVVDDSPSERAALVTELEQSGHFERILVASDGATALRAVAERMPDVIVSDLFMPGMDGMQLLRMRAAHAELREIPLLILTADTSKARKLELFERGASDYVQKPVDPRELIARVLVHMRLRLALEELRRMSCTDALTGLVNRRHFDHVLTSELAKVTRYRHALSIVMVDIDHFKQVNDTHGHAVGDAALRAVASALTAGVRKADVVARYGGEELVVVLANTNLDGAKLVAERLRAAVELAQFATNDAALTVTASFGVAAVEPNTSLAPGTLIERADAALYAAKHAGRNQVVVWTPEIESAPKP